MKILIKIMLFFAIGCSCPTLVLSQKIKPYFNSITTETGLPESQIISFTQDKYGYLWFGTQNGLVRYDGFKLKNYPFKDREGNTVDVCVVSSLYEDSHGTLWAIIFESGIYTYNIKIDAFEQIKIENEHKLYKDLDYDSKWIEDEERFWIIYNSPHINFKNPKVFLYDSHKQRVETFSATEKGKYHLPATKQRDLIKDKKGVIWATSDSLLSFYDVANKNFIPYFTLSGFPKNTVFERMTIDPIHEDIIWMTTRIHKNPDDLLFGNVVQFNTKTKKLKKFSHDKKVKESIMSDSCLLVTADSLKRLWFVTKKGVSLYNQTNDSFTNIEFDPNNKVPFTASELASDKEGNIWIGGSFVGLWFLDVKTGKSILYTHSEEEGSLPNCYGGINNIIFDRAQNLWLTLPCTGIAYENTQKAAFNSVQPTLQYKGKEVKFGETDYRIVGEDGDHSFFIYDNTNLLSWNTSLNTLVSLELKVPAKDKNISFVFKDSEGLLWINYWDFGLRCYNTKTQKYKDYKNDPKDSTTIGSKNINQIIEDKNGILWIGTRDKGLNSFSKKTNKFEHYPYIENSGTLQPKDSLDDKMIHCMVLDEDGILWIGTNVGGLNRFDTKTKKFKSYHNFKEGIHGVLDLVKDSNNQLWLATYLDGLFLFDKETETFINYSEEEGLLFNSITKIAKDNAGNIWATSERGLSKFNTKTKLFANYTRANGLPTNKLYQITKRADGMFYIISDKLKMLTFDPENLDKNTAPPRTILESITYHPAHYKDWKKDSTIFTTDLQNITFAFNENKLSFSFIGLHFVNAPLNQYAYKLEGYDHDWINNGTQRTATYTNLSPGEYLFHVKSANSDGVWDENGTQIKITILSPWYRSWLAYGTYVIIFLLVLRLFSKYRERHLRADKERLERTVAERTLEVVKEKEKAEASEKAKHQFLANMSHEIRTPMNAIKGMTDILIRRNPKEDQKEYLEGIKQSSDSLLVIINDILDISKIEAGKVELEQESFSVNELVNNVHTIMQFKAEEKGLELIKEIPKENLYVQGDATRLRQILINLIGNAIKFTEKGTVTTSLKTESAGEKLNLHFTVSDTGIGIDIDRMVKIFESFEQAYSDTSRKFGGTGLGLSISKKLVELHNGNIWVESKKGKGSQFHFVIPSTLAETKNAVIPTEDFHVKIADAIKDIRILLVEDNAFNVVVAQEELEDAIEGVFVAVAENGMIAVEKLKSSTFDVILMDVQMPVMNGFEATRAIRNSGGEKANIPIIAMTANVLKEEVDLCYEAGMNDFIGKPFDTNELILKIYNLNHKKS
ncbi:MAG: response regulator [Saprospiraceae bacterium]|nr:response regulator [Saprospiraceae bacterium]